MLQMKLNFIQSLPEDQAKENYELKGKLLQAKQQLADFEASLTEAVTTIAPNKPLRPTPAQTLKQLVQIAKGQHSELMAALHCAQILRGERQQLQRLQISQKMVISERDIEIASLKQYREEEARRYTQRQRQLDEQVEQLQEKNDKLVEQLQQLKIQRISKEGPINNETDHNGTLQSSLRAQLMRAVLQRQQFQNKLQLKAREVQKSEKDKEAMEKYYDQKWNSEYKKVKIKLEQTYNLKIAQLEQQSQLRLLAIENELRQMQQEKAFYLERNEELEGRFNEDQKTKQALTNQVNELACKIDDFRLRSVENSLMFREEIRTIKVMHSEERVQHWRDTKRLQNKIEGLKSEVIDCRNSHTCQMAKLKSLHQEQVCKQADKFQAERQQLLRRHKDQIQQLQTDIFQQLDNAQIIRNQAQRKFQSTIDQLKAEHQKVIMLKDNEFQANNRRWIEKHCEIQNLLVINRRKFEEEIQRKTAEVDRLVQREYALHRQIEELKETVSKFEEQTQNLQGTLLQKNQLITEKEAFIASLSRDLANSIKQNEILLKNRKEWKNELLEVGKEFTKTFQDLKRAHEKQTNIMKGKIAELEDVNSKRLAMKRDVGEKSPYSQEKPFYRPEIHIREAENLILHKVKDYYETKLREEGEIAKTNYKNSHAILARKLKKNRAYVQQATSHRVFEPRETILSKTRYSSSVQKHYNFSMSKEKLKEEKEKPRVRTMNSFK